MTSTKPFYLYHSRQRVLKDDHAKDVPNGAKTQGAVPVLMIS